MLEAVAVSLVCGFESESVKADIFSMMLNWFRQAKRVASLWWVDPIGPGMESQLEVIAEAIRPS